MSLAQVLSTYLTLNLLVIVAFLTLKCVSKFDSYLGNVPSGRAVLRLHYVVLSAIGLLILIHPILPKSSVFQPAAKVWSAQSLKTFSQDYTASEEGGYLGLSSKNGGAVLHAKQVSWVLLILCALVAAYGLLRIQRDLSELRRIRKRSFLVKRIRNVSILANDQITVPFSYWIPRQAVVIVPTSLMAKESDFKMAIAHEIQHHRQSDTKWVYGMWMLKVLCFLNPFVPLWNRWLSELQEFACDETLVDRNKVESQQYARCLIEVAETALNQKYVPVCATGLVFLVERNLLKRRIEKMMNPSKSKVTRSTSWSIGGLVFALMTVTAFAAQSIVQDKRVSLADAQAMAVRAKSETGFPIVVNELILKELNRYIGTPEGREFMRKSLTRMENYRSLVESKIAEYKVPTELMAVPIVESGYQNLEQSQHAGWGAGLWMFIDSTARNYGLRVDAEVDERLKPELLTDAAMRYLKGNRLLFNDWLLAVLAYNLGEKRVQKAIRETGTRDAWALVRAGYENDKSYLPRVMAAILIMRNPESVTQ